MGSLIGPWGSSSEETPPASRRWSDKAKTLPDELDKAREERGHRETRARLSAAAAAKAGAEAERASAVPGSSPPSGRRASTGTGNLASNTATKHHHHKATSSATDDLLREMHLGAWHRILANARQTIDPALVGDDAEVSVESAVVTGVASLVDLTSSEEEDFFDATQTRRKLDALVLERRGPVRTTGNVTTPREPSAHASHRTQRGPHVRVRLEVFEDEMYDLPAEEEEEEKKKVKEKDTASFVRVVEAARTHRAATVASATPSVASGWWDRTESAHLNRDVRQV